MKARKVTYCFVNTIEGWKYIKQKYIKDKIIIYSSSPEILFNNSIKEKKIPIDEINNNILKPLSNDLGILSSLIFSKFKKLGFSYNFSIQYIIFVLKFTNMLRFATTLNNNFFKNRVVIIKNNFDDSILNSLTNMPIERLLKNNKKLVVKKINIANKKFKQIFESPNFIPRLFMNGIKNFEFLLWRVFWNYFPYSINKEVVLLGLDGQYLRETAAYLSRYGYRFKVLPKHKIEKKKKNINKKLLRKIDYINEEIKRMFKKYLNKEVYSITYKVFQKDLFSFLSKYETNVNYWKEYFRKNFKKSNEIKCFLSTHLTDGAFIGLGEYLIDKKIPIINFQHGHSREIRHQPEFDKWGTIFEPIADKTFVYNQRSKEISDNLNIFARGEYICTGVPSVYKKSKILFNNPEYKILFLSGTSFLGIKKTQIPTVFWSDKKRFTLELNLINKVFKKIPHKTLYKIYPLPGNLSESVIKKEISNSNNISFVKRNFDAHYFFYSKRIIVTYGTSSQLGWSIFSNLPVVFINTPDRPLKEYFKKRIKKSLFLFDYQDKNLYKKLNSFLSKSIDEIYNKWKEKKDERELLIKDLSLNNQNDAGKSAAKYILKMC